jgi:hypothetical protein
VAGQATLTGPDPLAPDRLARAGHAWLAAIHEGTGTARQTISFGQPEGTSPGRPDTKVGALVTLHAAASSGLLVSFRSDTPLVCTVSSTIVTAVATGACTITASQAGNAELAAAPEVARAIQVGTGAGVRSVTFGQPAGTQPGRPETSVGTRVDLAASVPPETQEPVQPQAAAPGPGQVISFRSDTPAVCTVSGATTTGLTTTGLTTTGSATTIGAGACVITATQPGDPQFAAASAAIIFQVGTRLKGQAVSFPAPPSTPVRARIPLTARASSGLAVTFRSDTPAVCTVSDATSGTGPTTTGPTTTGSATAVGAGTCTITATQPGNLLFRAAGQARAFRVSAGRKPQVIRFRRPEGTQPPVTVPAPVTLSASASSGLPVSFRSATPLVCAVSGTTVLTLAPGRCDITAGQGGSARFAAARDQHRSFMTRVGDHAQSIELAGTKTPPTGTVKMGPVGVAVNVPVIATSGLAVTLSATTGSGAQFPPACAVSGMTLITLAAGTCTVTADQNGSQRFSSVTQPFVFALEPRGDTPQDIYDFTVPARAVVGVPFVLDAQAKSGLAVSFRAGGQKMLARPGTPAVCTVSGATVIPLTAGTCTVTAFQPGSSQLGGLQTGKHNEGYEAAAPATRSIQVQDTQTIAFAPPKGAVAGAAVSLTATASSGLPVFFRSDTPAVCTVSGTTATTLTPGTCTITATQDGNNDYLPATGMARSFSVRAGTGRQIIRFRQPPGTAVGRPLVLFASATSHLPVSFRSDTPSVCTVSGTTVTALASGMCTITASQGGSASFRPATDVPHSLRVQAGTQSQAIAFGPISATRVGARVSLTATASSGLAVALRSASRPVCMVSGTTVTALAAGMCTISATQGGDVLYRAAPEVTQSFRVTAGKVAQTIAFTQPEGAGIGAAATLLATATSGLAVSFRAGTPACAVSGTTVITVASGACTITASQGGSSRYSAAGDVARTFLVRAGRQPQTISFGPPPQVLAGVPVTPVASATSGLPVSFRSGSPSVCTVSGTAVTTVTAGTCTITATQNGSTDFAAARDVTQSFRIRAGRQTQTIMFGPPAAARVGTPVTLTASATSGLPVSFRSGTPAVCTVSATTATTLAPGSCHITATQGGSAAYAAARAVTHTFAVGSGHESQWIAFGTLPDIAVGHPAVLTASASSGLPVSFRSGTLAVCTVSGATVTTLAAGTCTITATQGGSATYAAAHAAPRSFQVNPAAPKIPGALIGALAAVALAATSGVLALRRRRLRSRPPPAPAPSVRAAPHPGPPGSASVRTTGASVMHTVRIQSDPGASTMTIKETQP